MATCPPSPAQSGMCPLQRAWVTWRLLSLGSPLYRSQHRGDYCPLCEKWCVTGVFHFSGGLWQPLYWFDTIRWKASSLSYSSRWESFKYQGLRIFLNVYITQWTFDSSFPRFIGILLIQDIEWKACSVVTWYTFSWHPLDAQLIHLFLPSNPTTTDFFPIGSSRMS